MAAADTQDATKSPGASPRERSRGPLDRRTRALAVMFEGYVMAMALLGGWTIVFLAALVGIVPDTQKHTWALFSVAPLMIASAALIYRAIARTFDEGPLASPVAPGNVGEAAAADGRSRNLRAPIEPHPAAATTPRAIGVVLTHTALALAGSSLIAVVFQALGLEVEEQAVIKEIVAGGLGWRPGLVGLGVGAVLLAPLAEEWLFRGMLFRRLWHLDAPVAAYLLPSLIFAAIHFNPSGLLTYLWLGVVFAHAYRLTGRLWVAMLVHFGNNLFTFVVLLATAGAASAS